MNATRKVKLKDININLICSICKGYMIDPTTTIECLHSFCKSCIVKHLEGSEYCPVCDVQLHSTKPLSGIRPDKMLQEIIYKLVPGLFANEMGRRRKFYREHPSSTPISQDDSGEIYNQPYITSDDKINLSLEYCSSDAAVRETSKRYFHCPAAVTITVLKKLVQGKHELSNDSRIEILYGERILPDDFLLMDIAYKYSWTESMTKPLELRYRIRGPHSNTSGEPPTNKASPMKKKSRSFTDSEVLKAYNANTPNASPKLTPNGKLRGRKKRLNELQEEGTGTRTSDTENASGSPASVEQEHNDSSTFNPSTTQKEVQLRISESGVISAKSLTSGEEKIIIGPEESNCSTLKTESTVEIHNLTLQGAEGLKTEPEANPINRLSQLVHLNIPVVNGNHSAKPASQSKKKALNSPAQKHEKNNKTSQKSNGGAPESFENKVANVQKALHDLQRHHFAAADARKEAMQDLLRQHYPAEALKAGKSTSPSIATDKKSLNSDIPLPFPLSALASSGMTVNLIPSSELKQNSGLKGKDLFAPSPSQPKKSRTDTVNGIMKQGNSSSKSILQSPSKLSTPEMSVEKTSPKPKKFFKSRETGPSASLLRPDLPSSPKLPKPITTTPKTECSKLQAPKPPELKLINSTSCTKLGTTTTPSTRMTTTPSTVPIQMASAQVYGTNPISQSIMQYWNALQFRLPQAQNNFLPLVTNDFISMPYLNQNRSLMEQSLANNFAYQNLLFSNGQLHYVQQQPTPVITENKPTSAVTPAITKPISTISIPAPTDLTTSKRGRKPDSKGLSEKSQELPAKKPKLDDVIKNVFQIAAAKQSELTSKLEPEPNSSSISNASQPEVKDDNKTLEGQGSEEPNNKAPSLSPPPDTHGSDAGSSDSGIEMSCRTLSRTEDVVEKESKGADETQNQNPIPEPCVQKDAAKAEEMKIPPTLPPNLPETEGDSEDSADLVINEDEVVNADAEVPQPPVENGNFCEKEKEEKAGGEPSFQGLIANGAHKKEENELEKGDAELMKSSSICINNNNNNNPAAEAAANISPQKLTSNPESSTGA